MNRAAQITGWIFLSPLLGIIQAVASFALIMLQRKQLGSPDLHRLILGIAVVYGCGWFVPAFLVSDFFCLKRELNGSDFLRYVASVASAAVLIGFCTPGLLIMVGFPITAATILAFGYVRRTQKTRQDRARQFV
jgi:hypothetical protein